MKKFKSLLQLVALSSNHRKTQKNSSQNIPSKVRFNQFFSIFNFLVEGVSYYNSASTAQIKTAGTVAATVTTAVTAGLMIFTFPIALTLIKLFQMIDFLMYVNVDLPVNVQEFLDIFDQHLLNLIPNPLEVDEGKIKCTPHEVRFEFLQSILTKFRSLLKKTCHAHSSTISALKFCSLAQCYSSILYFGHCKNSPSPKRQIKVRKH